MAKEKKEEKREEKKTTNFFVPALLLLLVGGAFWVGTKWSGRGQTGQEAKPAQQIEVEKEAGESGKKAAQTSPAVQQPAVLGEEKIAAIGEGGVSKGEEDAPVTIVEFSDFQCPACRGGFQAVHQILTKYSDQVRFVFRHFPLSIPNRPPLARPASLASLCAGDQKKFWEYHDKIFENQQELSEASLKKWAKDLGLNEVEFNACLEEKRHEDEVNRDYDLGLQVNVGGTPTFFVNGKVVGWKDRTEGWTAALERYIQAELAD